MGVPITLEVVLILLAFAVIAFKIALVSCLLCRYCRKMKEMEPESLQSDNASNSYSLMT